MQLSGTKNTPELNIINEQEIAKNEAEEMRTEWRDGSTVCSVCPAGLRSFSLFIIEHLWKYKCFIVWMTDRTWTDCTSISNSPAFVCDCFSIASTLTKAYCFMYFTPILSCSYSSSAFWVSSAGKSIWYRLRFVFWLVYSIGLLVTVAPIYPFSLLPEALMYQEQKNAFVQMMSVSWLADCKPIQHVQGSSA